MPDPAGWFPIALQSGGAVATVFAFIWYLLGKNKQDEAARTAFMAHLSEKDEQHLKALDTQMEYLKSRDVQSKEIAMSGQETLREMAEAVHALRADLRERLKSI